MAFGKVPNVNEQFGTMNRGVGYATLGKFFSNAECAPQIPTQVEVHIDIRADNLRTIRFDCADSHLVN